MIKPMMIRRFLAALVTAALALGCLVGCEELSSLMSGMSSPSEDTSASQTSSSQTSQSSQTATTSQTSSQSTSSASASASASTSVQVSTSSASIEEELRLNPTFRKFAFDNEIPGTTPVGYQAYTFGSPEGRWEIVEDATAPSPKNAAAQLDGSASSKRYTALLRGDLSYKKQQLRTQVKIAAEGATQAAGLLVHAKDAGNGYAIILDARLKQIRLERVVRGLPLTLKTQGVLGVLSSLKIETNRWYLIEVEVRDDKERCIIKASVNGIEVFEHGDNVFLGVEMCGPVTVNDTKAWFDDISGNEKRKIEPTPKPTATPKLEPTPKPSRCIVEHKYKFDSDTVGAEPKGFKNYKSGDGSIGSWPVVKSDGARSKPNVLLQDSREQGAGRFNLMMLEQHEYNDFEVQIDLRTLSGQKDNRMAGLVFRYQDPNNYYFAGVDTSNDEVVLVRVANGERQRMGAAKKEVKNDKWYELKVSCMNMNITVELDDDQITKAVDNTFMSGKVGVFTKSDTNAHFDDLRICALTPPIR